MSAPTVIEQAVAAGDRRRRVVQAANAVVRHAPWTAAALVAAALAVRLAGGSAAWTIAAFSAAVLYLVLVAARAAWPKVIGDRATARLDRDAELEGALRSAAWFSQHPTDSAWTDFHVGATAERLHSVEWREVYASQPTRRPLLAVGAATILAVAVAVWPAREIGLFAGSRDAAGAGARAATPPDLAEALRQLAGETLTPEEAQALIEKLLEDPRLDAELRKQLETMASQQQQMTDSKPDPDSAGKQDQQMSGGSQAEGTPPDSEDMQWAKEDMASKLANESQQRSMPPAPEKATPTDKSAGGQPMPASKNNQTAEQRERNSSGKGGLSLDADAEENNSGGGQQGEGLSSSGGARGANESLAVEARETAEALKKEIVRAIEAPEGKNIQVEEPHRTEARRSAIGFTGINGLSSYDRAKSDTNAVVPESRRALLERYFVREAQ